MSARNGHKDSALGVCLLLGLVGCCGTAAAADDEPPDLEFLEYLGSWDESDEEWLLFNDQTQEAAAREEQSDPEPEGEETTELENER